MKSLLLPSLTGALLLSGTSLLSANIFWASDSGNWSDASNWTPEVVPGSSHTAILNNGGTITLDQHVSIDIFQFTDGTLVNDGSYTFSPNETHFDMASIEGTGETTFYGYSYLGTVDNPWASLTIYGGSTVRNGGLFTQASGYDEETTTYYYGDLTFDTFDGTAATFINNLGGDFVTNAVDEDSLNLITAYYPPDIGSHLFENQGTFNKRGAGTTEISDGVFFRNSGLMTVEEGQLRLNGGSDSTGIYEVWASGHLALEGGEHRVRDGGSIDGAGTVSIAQYSELVVEATGELATAIVRVETAGLLRLEEGAASSIGLLEVNAGEVAIEGDHTFANGALREGGTLTGTGNATFTGNVAIGDFTFAAQGSHALEGTTTLTTNETEEARLGIEGANTELVNQGQFLQTISNASHQSRVIFNESGGTGTSTFRNAIGAAFTSSAVEDAVHQFINAGYEADDSKPAALFINDGTFTKIGLGRTAFGPGVNFVNNGDVVVRGGELALIETLTGSGNVSLEGGLMLLHRGATGNRFTFSGGALEQRFAANSDLSTTGEMISDFQNGTRTVASIEAGVTTVDDTVITAGFTPIAIENFASNEGRVSDVFHLGINESITFVLNLSVDELLGPDAYLGWLDGENQWVNAVDGNLEGTNNATGDQLGYAGTFGAFQALYGDDLSLYIGAWGHTENGVWAVLNHSSSYAVVQTIPEPGTWALIVGGAAGMVALHRRRARRCA